MASVTASFQCFLGTRLLQPSAVKARSAPGAIPAASMAASIKKVPEPHIGSISGSSALQPLKRRRDAASVSVIGAFPAFSR